eukprot:gene20191-biopygen3532
MGLICSKDKDDLAEAEEVVFHSIGDAGPPQKPSGSAAPRRKASVRRQLRALKKTKDPVLRAILDEIQPNNIKFFGKLNDFNKNKMGIEALRLELMPNDELSAVVVEVVGLFKDGDESQIKLEFYQRQLDGKSPITSTEEVYEVADKVLPLFKQMLDEIAKAVGADVIVKMSPGLKAVDRALQKAEDDYSDRACPNNGPAIGWVFDIVRGTLSCGTIQSVIAVIALLVKDKRITVRIKFKNRFKHPTPNGFCDMLLQVVFADQGLVHTCEIQVHLRPITEYAVEHKSHESYDYFRQFFQGSMNTVAARLADMAKIVGPDFAPADDGVEAKAVLEDIVVDVLESKDNVRFEQLSLLLDKYLSELALTVQVRIAQIDEMIEQYGPNHIELGSTYNNMAIVLEKQGKLDEAMEMYQKALAITIKALGPNHSSVGGTYNNMAVVLESQGKLDEAMEMYQKALAITIKALGPDHSDVGATYNNMASVLESQGKLDEAMEMYQKALAIRIKALGPDHSSVGDTYNNMASVLKRQGKLDEAMEMFQKALAIRIKALGPDHSDVGGTYNNMAVVLESQGKLDEAMEMYQKALAIKIKALGPDHSSVGDTYNNMAVVLKSQGNLDEAMEMYQKALAIKIKALGPDHSDVGQTYNNMAIVLQSQGQLDEAMEMYQKALAIKIKALGPDHSSVGATYNNMAVVLQSQGKLDEAMEMYQKALAIKIKALGPDHPSTGDTYYNMALLAETQGQLAKALELFTRTVTAYEVSYGAEHSETVDAKKQVDRVRGMMA